MSERAKECGGKGVDREPAKLSLSEKSSTLPRETDRACRSRCDRGKEKGRREWTGGK